MVVLGMVWLAAKQPCIWNAAYKKVTIVEMLSDVLLTVDHARNNDLALRPYWMLPRSTSVSIAS